MENSPSPLETLRQLKEMLDAGTITPAEFEALKQKLVFNEAAPAAGTAPVVPAAPELHSPTFEDVAAEDVPAAAAPVNYTSEPPAFAAPVLPPGTEASQPLREYSASLEEEELPQPPARNPLNLILSIGGLLALLSLVVYLSFNNRSSEHLTSTSQTSADSLTTAIETGPQAEQIELAPAAAPETIRLAPANPAPAVVTPKPTEVVRDSAKTAPPAAVADSAGKQ
jgi:hypothetical protein